MSETEPTNINLILDDSQHDVALDTQENVLSELPSDHDGEADSKNDTNVQIVVPSSVLPLIVHHSPKEEDKIIGMLQDLMTTEEYAKIDPEKLHTEVIPMIKMHKRQFYEYHASQ